MIWNLRTASYAVMLTGLTSFITGAGLSFVYPSKPLTVSWFLMVGGWTLGMIGMVIYAYTFFKLLKVERRDERDTPQ